MLFKMIMVQGDYDEYMKDYSHLKVNDYLKIVRERDRRIQILNDIEAIVYDYNEYKEHYSDLTLDEYTKKIEQNYYKSVYDSVLSKLKNI